MTNNTGILLTNIGTPDAPTPHAVRHYLKKFLTDPRVVELPQILWKPILYGLILPLRSRNSAKLYQGIWTSNGSPLLINSQKLVEQLQTSLQLPVELGMHYSDPSISTALDNLRKKQVKKIIVLPLYPQYSATTTASTFDIIANTFKKWRDIPELTFIHDYATNEHYIKAIVQSIRHTWEQQGQKHLLFSFHGIPQRYIDAGDPYAIQCQQTVEQVTTQLGLNTHQWSLSFQSRLGRAKWLTPYTSDVLQQLPSSGVKDIQVICPGFSVDCLETLEEIAIQGKELFTHAGGESFYYIPALNDSDSHIQTLKNILLNHTSIPSQRAL